MKIPHRRPEAPVEGRPAALRPDAATPAPARPGRAVWRRRTLWRTRIGARGGLVASLVLATALAAGVATTLAGCDGGATTIPIPTVYVVVGRVVDPTTSPIAGIQGAQVGIDGDPLVAPVATDVDGNFILQGVPYGTQRLRVDYPGRVVTLSYDFEVTANVVGALLPLFTPQQVDSILAAQGAPAWNRSLALAGVYALKSTGVPLGDATVNFAPSPGGTLVQTGEGKDPIVVVNGQPGRYEMSLGRTGYLWPDTYPMTLQAGMITFAAPRARPNLAGFVFADNPSGAPVSGARAEAVGGPDAGAVGTTNFVGQYSLVGLRPGTYSVRLTGTGYLNGLSFPYPVDVDTTLSQVFVHPDTLAAWAAAGGGPAPDLSRGHIAVDVRAAEGGAVLEGARVEVEGATGARGQQQTAGTPALAFDVPPGLWRVRLVAPQATAERVVDSVWVEAGTVTWTRVDLPTTAAATARNASRRPR